MLTEVNQSQNDNCMIPTYMRHLEQSNSQKQKYNEDYHKLGEDENRELLFIAYRVAVLEDEKVLDLFHNNVYILNTTELYTG